MLLKQVIEDDPPAPRKFDSHIPRDLETIILKCLEKEPAKRFATAGALGEELERFLAGVPIRARPVGSVERLVRWCRRKPVTAGLSAAAVTGLVFGLIAATTGYVQTRGAMAEAQQSQMRAEQNLRHLRQAVEDLFTDVSEDVLLDQPGMQPLRAKLLGRARDYYERLLAQSGKSDEIHDELALAHFRVGQITEAIESPEKAVPSYRQAEEAQRRLAAADPRDRGRLRALGDTLNALGRALQTQDADRARAAFAEALQLRRRLVAQDAGSADDQRALANTLMNIGLLEEAKAKQRPQDQAAQGTADHRRARQLMTEAQSIRRSLLDNARADPAVRRGLLRDFGKGAYNLGELAIAGGDLDQAAASLDEARDAFEEMVREHPDDIAAGYRLAVCCRLVADVKSLQGDRSGAVAVYALACSRLRPIAVQNPRVGEYQVALAEILINLGQAHFEGGADDEARASFAEAASALAPVVNRWSEAGRGRYDYIVTLHALGKLQPDAAGRAEAIRQLDELRPRVEEQLARDLHSGEARQLKEMLEAATQDLQSEAANAQPSAASNP